MPRTGLLAALAFALCLLALPATASARSFTGSIAVTSVGTPTGPFAYVDVTAHVSVQETCDPAAESCLYVLSAFAVPAGDPCTQSLLALRWGDITLSASVDQTFSWKEYPPLSAGRRTVCLYRGVGGLAELLAQDGYTVPDPPGAEPAAKPTPAPPPVTIRNYVCGDFTYQEDAQAQLTPGDPNGLDPDGNGVACDGLPHRPVAPAPAPAAAPAPTPAKAALKAKEAAGVARDALAARYRATWTRGARKQVTCRTGRQAGARDCVATWIRGDWRYRATVTVARKGEGYRYEVRARTRTRR